jgi:hypothetical protein
MALDTTKKDELPKKVIASAEKKKFGLNHGKITNELTTKDHHFCREGKVRVKS